MFINKLIYFHKVELSQNNLVFKHIRSQYITFLSIIIITSVSLVSLLITNKFLFLIVPISIYIFSIYSINKSIRKVIKREHNIDIDSVLKWTGWREYKVKLIKVFLDQNNRLEQYKIKNYTEFIEKEAIKSKPSFYFFIGIRGFLLALFIPVWNYFNNWIFTNIINSLEEGVIYLTSWILTLIFLGIFIGTIKLIASDILESNYRKLNELAYLLELVNVSLDEKIIDKTIIEKVK
ncbi:hypothetical protein [Gracilibacillus saliphilus]|uniref:hypothetical protein n=1 Tax=Gracilibacillus saliphilus TaxID=543890 RepID=UPI0013D0426C|nr:hypothetical protein [Gracilibacillus saliphilus]